jgi:hypothetical protein
VTRREFITLIGGAAAWPLAARAQAKLPTMGTISPSAEGLRLVALVQRLRELGWIEDRNVAIAVQWAEGRPERYSEIAAEFIRLKVDVIVTGGTQSVLALKQATSIIPIVFATVADPVGIGLVASLARPGGNLTGVNFLSAELVAKGLILSMSWCPRPLVWPYSSTRPMQHAPRSCGPTCRRLPARSGWNSKSSIPGPAAKPKALGLSVPPRLLLVMHLVALHESAFWGGFLSLPRQFATKRCPWRELLTWLYPVE